MTKDNTEYEFEGVQLGKGKLVLNVVKHYIKHSNKPYEQLKLSFASVPANREILIDKVSYDEKYRNSPDIQKRYFVSEPLVDVNGKQFYVSNQWGRGNIDGFVLCARELGMQVDIVADKQSKLIEFFNYYKRSPSERWLGIYQKKCDLLANIDVNEFDFSNEHFLEDYWRSPNNGISSVKPGMLSKEEFTSLKSELPAISKKIALAPTSETLDDVMLWAQKAKNNGKFSTIKSGVIHRFFCACDPEHLSTILSQKSLQRFAERWNKEGFGPTIDTKGNWWDLNYRVVQAVKMRGLEHEDKYLVNTFVYRLKEYWSGENNSVFGETDSFERSTTSDSKAEPKQYSQMPSDTSLPLNQILFGPPGTGKTYNTIDKALSILDAQFLKDFGTQRTKLKERFDGLTKQGLIHFVTFHQSFSYEDFVEGLRANSNEGAISYDVEPGVFKTACIRANKGVSDKLDAFDKAIGALIDRCDQLDERLKLTTLREKSFSIEYSGGNTFKVFPESTENENPNYVASISNVKKLYLTGTKKGIYNQSYVEGLLIFLKEELGLPEYEKNKVESLATEPVVLIIDEINRGNISSIFGELITLVEPSKRAGAEEALSVTLPYSKELFQVPNNLYLIGTMNTADRSLALMDTALRRRFDFVEMMPQVELLEGLNIEGIDVPKMLATMNKRIEVLYDREHTLGHAFFMPLVDMTDSKKCFELLQSIFANKILPLLEEYFFEDWKKIRLVLGDNQKNAQQDQFITENGAGFNSSELFGSNADLDFTIEETKTYSRNDKALERASSYISIYDR